MVMSQLSYTLKQLSTGSEALNWKLAFTQHQHQHFQNLFQSDTNELLITATFY